MMMMMMMMMTRTAADDVVVPAAAAARVERRLADPERAAVAVLLPLVGVTPEKKQKEDVV